MTTCPNWAATRRSRPSWPTPADIGFAGVELGGKFPRDPAVLKPLLAGYGLDLVGGW